MSVLFKIKNMCGVFALFALFLTINPAHARDTLVVGMSQYPSTYHPNIDSMSAKTYILGATMRPFTIYNPDWQPICMLCTEYPTFENERIKHETRKDGTPALAVTYTIQPGAKWGDGTPITTSDVLFTWEVGKHPQVGTSNFELFSEDIVDITAHDGKNFTLHFDKISCNAASIDDFNLIPEHLERPVFEKDPATYQQRTLYDADTTNPGLYSGPYIISHVSPGSQVVLERNPHWWGKPPRFDKSRYDFRGAGNAG